MTAQAQPKGDIETFKDLMTSIQRDGIPDLLKWIEEETDFYIAPSSTHFHDCEAGGLLKHSLNVYTNLSRLVPLFTVEVPPESLILIALMHDLCKVRVK